MFDILIEMSNGCEFKVLTVFGVIDDLHETETETIIFGELSQTKNDFMLGGCIGISKAFG